MAATDELAQDVPVRSRLRCWGDFALVDGRDGSDLKPRSRKSRALLAYLAMHPGKSFSRERLAALLWGDRGEAQARASLRQALVELKPLANGGIDALEIGRDQISLRAARIATDVDELRTAAGRRDYAAVIGALPEPDERLFANLDDIDEGFDEWLAIERSRQRDALLALLAECATTARSAGESRSAATLDARLREYEPRTAVRRSGLQLAAADEVAAVRPKVMAQTSRKAPLFALLAAVVLLLGIGAWWATTRNAAAPATIAVLPFRDLSGSGDSSFAEGLSEEVLAQLAREPGLRVAGSTSSAQFKDRRTDLGQIGRQLGVRYILEGNVRTVGGRVRVNVALAEASNGLQLWAETFDGTLNDVLDIQNRIGASVAGALGRRLVSPGKGTASRTTTGEVYTLYLSARGLIRERNPVANAAAREKLQQAVRLDPAFAPAWSSLAQTTRFYASGPDPTSVRMRKEATSYARRAVALAPDLAEAHGVLGMTLGFDDPAGQKHIERAANLDSGNAEFQFWLGHVYAQRFDFPRMRTAYQTAFAIDPLWNLAQMYAVHSAWQSGQRSQALAHVDRVARDGSSYNAHTIKALLAKAQGDASAAVGELRAAVASTGDPGKKSRATYHRALILFNLGFIDDAEHEWRKSWSDDGTLSLRPEQLIPQQPYLALRRGQLPDFATFRSYSRNLPLGDSPIYLTLCAKLLINSGKPNWIVAMYDSEQGFIGLSRDRRTTGRWDELVASPIVASALIAVGRADEAQTIAARIERSIDAVDLRDNPPAEFLTEAAQIWAIRGNHDAALAALERARQNGWIYVGLDEDDTSLGDIGNEPAFRSLRGHPRFERLRRDLSAQRSRERIEIARQIRQDS